MNFKGVSVEKAQAQIRCEIMRYGLSVTKQTLFTKHKKTGNRIDETDIALCVVTTAKKHDSIVMLKVNLDDKHYKKKKEIKQEIKKQIQHLNNCFAQLNFQRVPSATEQ